MSTSGPPQAGKTFSANGTESDLQRSKDSGIDAHLVKPMDLALLLDTIEALTAKKRPEQEGPGR